MEQVSVVIPSYNSQATLMRTLDSLFAQEPSGLLKEVLVVDSSDDGKTPALLETMKRERTRVVRLPARAFPATARNAGARAATGELLAFIDSDAYADPSWLSNIVSSCERGHRVGGGSVLLPPEQFKNGLAVAQYFLQFSEFMGGEAGAVRFTPSCNLFCERELFEEVGGFPDIRAAEDVLFGAKFSGRVPFYFEPSARVHHIFTTTWKRYRTNQKLLGQYTLLCRRKLDDRWMYRGVFPFFLMPFFFAAKFLRISTRVQKSGDPQLKAAFFRNIPLLCVGLSFLAWGFGTAGFKKWRS